MTGCDKVYRKLNQRDTMKSEEQFTRGKGSEEINAHISSNYN